MLKNEAPSWIDNFSLLEASGGGFGLVLGSIWGESTIFEVPGGSKKRPKWLRKQLPAATWLQERLGSLWGSILDHFGFHFELLN